MTLTPLGTRVIIEPDKVQEYQTKGGIIMIEEAQEKPFTGTVRAVGKGVAQMPEPEQIAAGDRVLYGKYSGSEIKIDGNIYLIMRYEDISAVVGPEEKKEPEQKGEQAK